MITLPNHGNNKKNTDSANANNVIANTTTRQVMSPHEVSLVTQKSSTKELAKQTIAEYLTVLSLSLAKKFM